MSGTGLFLQGTLLGLAIAMPVGPIGVLCIRRSLADGMAVGFATGLGAAAADGFYGLLAGLGLGLAGAALAAVDLPLRLGGAALLLWLAWRGWWAEPAAAGAPVGASGLLAAFGATFLLTLTNPMTILSFVAIFAGLGVAGGGALPALLLAAGCFLGSAAWWLVLAGGVAAVRGRLGPGAMRLINRGASFMLAGFAILTLVR